MKLSCVPPFSARANAAYVEDMQAEYERNPGSVSDEWRHFFESLNEERGGSRNGERGPSWGVRRRSCSTTASSSRR